MLSKPQDPHPPVWSDGPPAYRRRQPFKFRKSPLATVISVRKIRNFETLEDACDYWDREMATKTFVAASIVAKMPNFSLKIQAEPPVNGTRFHAAVFPLLQDAGCDEEVRYVGCGQLDNGTNCFSFSGWCPVHKRTHEDHTWFQLQQHPQKDVAYWKCFRDNTSKKLDEVALLRY